VAAAVMWHADFISRMNCEPVTVRLCGWFQVRPSGRETIRCATAKSSPRSISNWTTWQTRISGAWYSAAMTNRIMSRWTTMDTRVCYTIVAELSLAESGWCVRHDFLSTSGCIHCVQKKTPTDIFFHISMSDVWILTKIAVNIPKER